MKIELGKLEIISDDRQYVVREPMINKHGDKEFKNLGYFTNLPSMVRFLSERSIKVNDDIKEIQSELRLIEKLIKEVLVNEQ